MYQFRGGSDLSLLPQHWGRYHGPLPTNAAVVELEDANKAQAPTDGYFPSRWIVRCFFRHCNNELIEFSACVASIIRVPYIARTSLIDPSWSDTYGAIWSVVELTIGIVSACLPTLRPLYVHVFHRPVTGASGSKTSDKSSSAKHDPVKLRYLQMPDIEYKRGWKSAETNIQECDKGSRFASVDHAETV